jgi:hypothetical protein
MSRQHIYGQHIYEIEDSVNPEKSIFLTSFYGDERGRCIQVSIATGIGHHQFVELPLDKATDLMHALDVGINGEMAVPSKIKDLLVGCSPKRDPIAWQLIADRLVMFGKGLGTNLKVAELPMGDGFIASFPDVEVKDRDVLISDHGRGATPEAAAADYAKQLSGRLLVLNAMGSLRREVVCPDLTHYGGITR